MDAAVYNNMTYVTELQFFNTFFADLLIIGKPEATNGFG